jgi:cephalosporin-C deacetylase
MLYDIDRFTPDVVVQPDHRQFWDGTLDVLSRIPLEPTLTRVEEYKDHPTEEIYDVTFTTWGSKRIHAVLRVPRKRTGPLPAVLAAHPNMTGFKIKRGSDGVYGSNEFQRNPGLVTISPLIRGFAPDAPGIPANIPWWGDLSSRDDYCAREWYCSMVRAVDYLATRPDLVDMDRLVATGGSQGGSLALVAAALDPRIKHCFSMCPAACQFHEMIEHYPSFGPGKGQIPEGQTLEDLTKTLSYYDVVNFCPWITCPTTIGLNVGDTTVHSMGGLAAFKNLTALDDSRKHLFLGHTYMHGASKDFTAAQNHLLENLKHVE